MVAASCGDTARYGPTAARLLAQVRFWLAKPGVGVEREGRRWVYNCYDEWGRQTGLTGRQARYALQQLEAAGALVSRARGNGYGGKLYALVEPEATAQANTQGDKPGNTQADKVAQADPQADKPGNARGNTQADKAAQADTQGDKQADTIVSQPDTVVSQPDKFVTLAYKRNTKSTIEHHREAAAPAGPPPPGKASAGAHESATPHSEASAVTPPVPPPADNASAETDALPPSRADPPSRDDPRWCSVVGYALPEAEGPWRPGPHELWFDERGDLYEGQVLACPVGLREAYRAHVRDLLGAGAARLLQARFALARPADHLAIRREVERLEQRWQARLAA